jgi:hypothetical protein
LLFIFGYGRVDAHLDWTFPDRRIEIRTMLPALVTATALLCLTGACGGTAEASAGVAQDRRDTPGIQEVGTTLPVPENRVILTLSGVGRPNVGNDLELDLATLQRMPWVQATVYEPFLKREIRFGGVLLSDLLSYAGVEATSTMEVTALDDHLITFDLGQLDERQVLVATDIDGWPIQIADGGPSRFVFLDASDDPGSNTDNWIWSLTDMTFETTNA